MNLGTTKGDLAEAILEGICFEMRDILDMKMEQAGEIKKIRLGGGVAKSQMWCQMFADVLETTAGRVVPKWLELNKETSKAKVVAVPEREDIDVPVNEILIVEFYSK